MIYGWKSAGWSTEPEAPGTGRPEVCPTSLSWNNVAMEGGMEMSENEKILETGVDILSHF